MAELVVGKITGAIVRGRKVQARLDQPKEDRPPRSGPPRSGPPRGGADRPAVVRSRRPSDAPRAASIVAIARAASRSPLAARPYDKGDRPSRPVRRAAVLRAAAAIVPLAPFNRDAAAPRKFDGGNARPTRPRPPRDNE